MKNKNIKTAWLNATRSYNLSPVFVAIAEALESIPEEIKTQLDFETTYEIAKRIAAPANGTIYGPRREELATGEGRYEGEWHITDTDLNVWSLFVMWMHRFDEDFADFVCDRISRALSNKRMQQAADRFLKTGLTAQHCALLENMRWDMDFLRGDWVSLHVQGKRPFGNSGITGDIIEHAGIEAEHDEMGGYSDEAEERAWGLFDELIFAAPEAAKAAGRALKGGEK